MNKLSGSIMDALNKGPIVADGKLECAIAAKLGLDKRPQTYRRLVDWLEKGEAKGILVIERRGAVMRKVELAKKSEPIPTKEEMMNESEVASDNVEGVAVEIETEASEPSVTNVSAGNEPLSLYAQLSSALFALQKAADPDGILVGPTAQIIADDLKNQGININKANALNAVLAKLGLRVTSGSRATRTNMIDMTTKEVTREMVESLATIVPKVTTVEPEEANLPSTEPVEPTLVVKSIEEQLADVIEGQDREIRELKEQMITKDREYADKVEKGTVVINNQKRLLEEADAKIAALQAPPSERIKSLLARHLPSTDTQE